METVIVTCVGQAINNPRRKTGASFGSFPEDKWLVEFTYDSMHVTNPPGINPHGLNPAQPLALLRTAGSVDFSKRIALQLVPFH